MKSNLVLVDTDVWSEFYRKREGNLPYRWLNCAA